MIGWLRGRVVGRMAEGELLLDVNGVGYRVSVTPTLLASSGAERNGNSSELALHVHTHVREDAIVLYGFATRDERDCFEALISAHGIGPAVALAILSTHRPEQLRRIVAAEDVDALVMVPGIGRKTAVRLMVDLQARLDLVGPEDGAVVVTLGAVVPGVRAEVQAALAGLGYDAEEVRAALRDLSEEEGAEAMLRAALRQASGAAR